MKPAPQSPPAPSDDDASLPALWRAARHLAQWLISIAGAPGVIVALRALAPKERAEMLSWLRPVEALLRRLLLIEAAGLINYLAAPKPRGTRAPRRRTGRFAEQDALDPPSWRVAFRALPRAPRAGRDDRRRGSRRAAPAAPSFESPNWIAARAFEATLDKPRRKPSAPSSPLRGRPAIASGDRSLRGSDRSWSTYAEQTEGAGASVGDTPSDPFGATSPEGEEFASRDLEQRSSADLSNPWPIAERVEAVIRVFVNPEPFAKRLARRLMAKPKLARRLTRPPRATPRPGLGDWALGHASALAEAAAGYFDTS